MKTVTISAMFLISLHRVAVSTLYNINNQIGFDISIVAAKD
jgi:hypothetical protein